MKANGSLHFRLWKCGLLLVVPWACHSSELGAPSLSEVADKGREFLVSLLDTNLDLLPEYRGAKVYWLFHDITMTAIW